MTISGGITISLAVGFVLVAASACSSSEDAPATTPVQQAATSVDDASADRAVDDGGIGHVCGPEAYAVEDGGTQPRDGAVCSSVGAFWGCHCSLQCECLPSGWSCHVYLC